MSVVTRSVPAMTHQPQPWIDLARNRPGANVTAAAQARTTWATRCLRLLGIRRADHAWRVGARGERKVGRTLLWARPLGWRALHAVPVGRGDIDHVLIGPAGVVTVNTKHHRGQYVRAGHSVIFVGQHQTQYAQASVREAERAARLLRAAGAGHCPVTPLIVVVGARRLRGRRTNGVRVVTRGGLLRWLLWQSFRRAVNMDQSRRTYEVARRSTTWTPTPRSWSTTG